MKKETVIKTTIKEVLEGKLLNKIVELTGTARVIDIIGEVSCDLYGRDYYNGLLVDRDLALVIDGSCSFIRGDERRSRRNSVASVLKKSSKENMPITLKGKIEQNYGEHYLNINSVKYKNIEYFS